MTRRWPKLLLAALGGGFAGGFTLAGLIACVEVTPLALLPPLLLWSFPVMGLGGVVGMFVGLLPSLAMAITMLRHGADHVHVNLSWYYLAGAGGGMLWTLIFVVLTDISRGSGLSAYQAGPWMISILGAGAGTGGTWAVRTVLSDLIWSRELQ